MVHIRSALRGALALSTWVAAVAGCGSSNHPSAVYDDGSCAPGCNGGCVSGHCGVVLASGQADPSAIAVDDKSVYWTSNAGLVKVPLQGGPETPVATAAGNAWTISLRDGYAYWIGDFVERVPIAGGMITRLGAGGTPSTLAMAMDDANVYWPRGDEILKVPIQGGVVQALATGQHGPLGIAVDAASVYWTTGSAGTVVKVPIEGGTPTELAQGQGFTWSVASDGAYVYWTSTNGTGSLVRMPVGGGPITTLAEHVDLAYGFALDGGNVYWIDTGVYKVSVAGGPVTTLALCADDDVVGIAVDETSVYFTRLSQGTVTRVTPK